MKDILLLGGAAIALLSAFCWFRSATLRVTREQVVAERMKAAEKAGTKPNLGGWSVGGLDPFEALARQSVWSARGAVCAAVAIIAQTAAGYVA